MTLLAMLLAVICTALIAHDFLRRADARRASEERALAFAQGAAERFGGGAVASGGDLAHAARRLLDFPWVLAVSIRDASGKPITQAAVEEGLGDLFGLEADTGSVSPMVRHLVLPDSVQTMRGPAELVSTPLEGRIVGHGPAELDLLIQMEPTAGTLALHVWAFAVPLVAVSLLALGGGAWWLRREVVQPIHSLVEVASAEDSSASSVDPFRRHRDLGAIAQGLSALRADLSHSQRRERTIERRADSRIAEETQRISRDLRRMERAAWMDALTAIYNRRFLEERFPAIFQAQQSSGSDLAVVMFDMDHFKLLNDSSGHAAGDEILQFAGELLRQCVRSHDFAARYGGDEFVLILPGVAAHEAVPIARRICALFCQRAKQMVKVTPAPSMTAGIAGLIHHRPADHSELLALADAALLAAKEAGKRQVRISSAVGTRVGRSGAQDTAASTPACAHL